MRGEGAGPLAPAVTAFCSLKGQANTSTTAEQHDNTTTPHSVPFSQMEDRLVINAYRHLYKRGLQAVRHATPARHVLRQTLRSSFRSESRTEFDPAKIARTLEFLDHAAESNSYEHKILKNLLHVRYYEQPLARIERDAKM
jgi:hypothetical protein